MASDAPADPSPEDLLRRLSQRSPTVSRYTLEGEVARGGMGSIIKVWDEDLRRHLAMKIVIGRAEIVKKGAIVSEEDRLLARFLEEAQVTGQLDHPGIVPVHELGLDSDGRVYFTMKLVKGRDLKTIFDLVFANEEGWNETRALGVILKACEAMAYAHSKGVIHRDLKPANVMVGNFGEVYVMDWGLSRVLGRKDTHDIRLKPDFATSLHSVKTERREAREDAPDSPIVTMDGDVIGTPTYMSPEQARGEIEKLSPRSDVYAIGAMLYHLLARQVPYSRPNARVSSRTVLAMVLLGPPAPLTSLRTDVPAELVAIVEKAMAREASERYADTLALAEDLRAFVEHRVVGAYETGAFAEAKKWVQRNKPFAAASAAAVLILIVGLSVSMSLYSQADANAKLAEKRRIVAEASEQRAKEQEALAKAEEAKARAEKANVLKLSAFQTLTDLTQEAEELWPVEPRPQLVERYRTWMTRAEALVTKLPEFRASLAEIEQRAVPQSAEMRAQERFTHPRAKELAQQAARLAWMKRMLGEEPWPNEVEVEVALAKEALPVEANDLNTRAWELVNPDKPVYGSEVRGFLLARRAVEAAAENDRGDCRNTLAWALFELSRFDEALTEGQRALAEAEAVDKQAHAKSVEKLEKAVKRWRDPDGTARALRVKDHEEQAQAVAALESEVSKRREWQFAGDTEGGESGDRWWHDQLLKLVASLESFEDPKSGPMRGVSEVRGWGVAKRLEFAASVEERTLTGADAQKRWSAAIAAIATSPKYGGLKQTPQLGLLPIGVDPESGLWEFAHVQSGVPPVREANGKLELKEDTGLVFVLIPGGSFWMGAQKTEPAGRNYDPQAAGNWSPVHEVELSPYFLSKYEMTQGQWERLTGKNPSRYQKTNASSLWNKAGQSVNALHPVEQISWTNCVTVLGWLGCELPTEAQWENGCRAGTNSLYWSGQGLEGLGEVANISDAYGKSHGFDPWTEWEKDVDDGNTVHAQIGSYRANAHGLHDVHGNVWEWCLDSFEIYPAGKQVDPVTPSNRFPYRMSRGGSFLSSALETVSAHRRTYAPEICDTHIGVRPAKASQPAASILHGEAK